MKRGFGSPNFDRGRALAIQRQGNAALRAAGKSHRFRGDAAVAAGKKGGAATARKRAKP